MFSASLLDAPSPDRFTLPPAPLKTDYLITAKSVPPMAKPNVAILSAAKIPSAIAALSVRDSSGHGA